MKTVLTKAWAFIRDKRAYLLSPALPAAILLLSYVVFGVYPFGRRSVLSLDLNAQYVYYYDYMYDVFAGKESLFYSWSRNLSGEFMGILGYYLASPFNFIVWLFPRKMITEGLMTMMIAKAAAAGLSCCFLLKKHRGYGNLTAVMFSVMYALCGFFVVQTMNPMWLDGLIALPLVVMGIEWICDKKSPALYVLSLLYIFVANFYIGYMTGIFSALYYLYYIASGKSARTCFGDVCGSVVTFGISSMSAILMSCFMILPVYKSLSNGKFTFSDPDFSPAESFQIADSFIKLFPATYDTVRMEGLPILYCGTLALVFAAVYFISRNTRARERIVGGVLVGFLFLSMYIRPLDMLWHGGQMPNWLPYRYSFLISFLLVLFGAQAFDGLRQTRGRCMGAAFGVLLAMLLWADYNAGHEYFDTTLIIVIPLCVLALICILAYAYMKKGGTALSITLAAAVCLECFMNTSMTLYDMHGDIVFSDRSTYLGDIPYSRAITDALHERDEGFYRMEKTYHRTVNDPIALRMYGMSHSSSTLNSRAIALLGDLGFSAREHYTRYDGATMLTDDIFGVKYVLSKYACYVPYTDIVDIENELGVTVYENTDALGLAYLADGGINGWDYSDGGDEPRSEKESPFLVQNALAKTLTGDEALTVFRPIDEVAFDSRNIKLGTTTDAHTSCKKKNESSEAWISFEITMPENGALYMYLPTDYERETYVYVNGKYLSSYFKYENYGTEYLGEYDEGETVKIKLELREDSVYYKSTQFYYVDGAELARFQQEMTALNPATGVVRESGTRLAITANAAKDCTLFTTIPAEEGWSAYIDGEPAELSKTMNDALLCLDVPEGEHEITLVFFPAGLKAGLILTGMGVITFALMLAYLRFIRRTGVFEPRSANNSPQETALQTEQAAPEAESAQTARDNAQDSGE